MSSSDVVNFTIDGQPITVPKGTTVYQAARQLGLDIPIFCYQDRMPPFGACRVCLVEVEKMGKLQTSCTLEATEGMVVKTQTPKATAGREEILEFLLINHPLDCPICDRGGECPLQDQVLHHGPGASRFFEDKRRFVKPLSLGPVLKLDRERCIVCARCTRFSDLISGDNALEMKDRGYMTEVGTPNGKTAESKFIGNTIMICPVGALTSSVYRFRARPWDNKPTESTCTLCPVGCSFILDSRDGELMRTRSLENRAVNDIWLCDKGWFGYEFVYNQERLPQPMIRRNGQLEWATWDEALTLIADKIQSTKSGGKLAVWGGNPLTTEENYLFQKLARQGLGSDHIDHRIGMPIFTPEEEAITAGMEQSIGECENLAFVLLLGVDLTEEFPVIWLRLRQAINRGAPAIFLGHAAPEIAEHLDKVVLHAPGQELDVLKTYLPQIKEWSSSGKKGAIFVGRQYLVSVNRQAILSELGKFKQDVPHCFLNMMEGRNNSQGARFAGMQPDSGLNAIQVLEAGIDQGWDFLQVAGANPALKFPSKLWKEFRSKLNFLVVQDLFLTETAREADVVLPTLSFVEKEGHFINIEGRVQKIRPGKEIPADIYSDAEIFIEIARKLGLNLTVDPSFLEQLNQERLPIQRTLNLNGSFTQAESRGSLKATFVHSLFDSGVRMRHDPHLIQLVKEPRIGLHPNECYKRQLKDCELVHISANGNSITGKIKMDKGVAEGTVVLPLGFKDFPVQDLGLNLLNGLSVEITKRMD